jgi:hypothetical protein
VKYSLVIKYDGLVDDADGYANALLTRHFGPEVGYHRHALLSGEIVYIVWHPAYSQRAMESMLNEWFVEATSLHAPFPNGTLLYWSRVEQRIVSLNG